MKKLRRIINNLNLQQESGIGLPIVLLLTAILVGSVSLVTVAINSVQESANETARQQGLNVAEGGTDYILANADGGFTLRTDQGLFDYNEVNSNGIVFPLEAGQTLELNPSQIAACQTSSCVIQIWWNSFEQGIDSTDPATWDAQCKKEAALLVSEYSQDDCDSATFQSCAGAGDVDPRSGNARERARYYLFRPASCAIGEAGRDWSGYETAFGNSAFHQNASYSYLTAARNMLGLQNPSDYQGTGMCDNDGDGNANEQCPNSGAITTTSKQRLEFRSNNDLSKNMSNYYEIPVFPNTTIVRIKALYANTQILVDLPGQVREGNSIVSDGSGNTQNMVIKHSIPAIPNVLDFALFVGQGGIDKNPEANRN